MAEQYLNIVYYVKVIKKYKWLILIVPLVTAALFTLMPRKQARIYETSLTAVVPEMYFTTDKISIGGITVGKQAQGSGGGFSIDMINGLMESNRMRADIVRRFQLDKIPGFYFKTRAEPRSYGLKINVEGSDPQLIVDIANFCIEELNVLNGELQLTSEKFIVKILDPATAGTPKKTRAPFLNKAIVVAMFAFLMMILFSFALENIKMAYQREKASK